MPLHEELVLYHGSYVEVACISQLLPERLKDQWCFRTEKAIGFLHYVGGDAVWT